LAEVTQYLATSAWHIVRGPSTATAMADDEPDSGFIQGFQSEATGDVAGGKVQCTYICSSRNNSTGPRLIQEPDAARHTYSMV